MIKVCLGTTRPTAPSLLPIGSFRLPVLLQGLTNRIIPTGSYPLGITNRVLPTGSYRRGLTFLTRGQGILLQPERLQVESVAVVPEGDPGPLGQRVGTLAGVGPLVHHRLH